MRKEEILSGILTRDVKVREIGVLQIKGLIKKSAGLFKKEEDGAMTINLEFFADNLEYSIKSFTDIKDKEIEELSGRDLITLAKKIKEVNADFLQDFSDLVDVSALVKDD
jgi:hypothetical protein